MLVEYYVLNSKPYMYLFFSNFFATQTWKNPNEWPAPTWSTPKPTSWTKPTWNSWPTKKPTRKPTWDAPTWSTPKPTAWSKPTWNGNSWPTKKPTRKPTWGAPTWSTPKPTGWSKPTWSTPKPTWNSGSQTDYDKYRIYTKDGNPVGYYEKGWDYHDAFWRDIISQARSECRKLFEQDKNYIAKAIRLSFHDCHGYDGCNGCVNLDHTDNNGLQGIMEALYFMWNDDFDHYMSRADFWIACALEALAYSTGDSYPMKFIGRKDCGDSNAIGDGGDYYSAYGEEKYHHAIYQHFYKYFGFDKTCTVAVMGLHDISTMRPKNSGHGKGYNEAHWVKNFSYKMTNKYFQEMLDLSWTYEVRDNAKFGYPQYGEKPQWYHGDNQDRTVMLNSDLALIYDWEEYTDYQGNVYCKVSDHPEHHDGKNPYQVPTCPHVQYTEDIVHKYAANYGLYLQDLERCMMQMYTTGYRDGYDSYYYKSYGNDQTYNY